MSCPDWKTLAVWREDSRAEEPAEWQDALAHLDRGCPSCRRAAVAADPTLVFRRLAAPGDRAAVYEPTPAQEASDVEAMRRAVAAMRAASRVETASTARTLGWKRWAAAAALAVAALSMPGDEAHLRRGASLIAEATPPEATPAALTAGSPAGGMLPASETAADVPIVEGVNRPEARVYQMESDELAVVMVVDESLTPSVFAEI